MMVVKGKQYRTNAPGDITIGAIRAAKREFGFGWATILDYMVSNAETDLLDMLCDDQFLAWMWAWMAHAGDEMPIDELRKLMPSDIVFTQSDTPEAEKPDVDPTSAPTDSAPEGAPVAVVGARPRSTTKKSKKQSTAA